MRNGSAFVEIEDIACEKVTGELCSESHTDLASKYDSLSQTVEVLKSTALHQTDLIIQNESMVSAVEKSNSTVLHGSDLIVENQSVADAIERLNMSVLQQTEMLTQNNQLLEVLERVNTTLGSTPEGSFFEVILGALFSVIAAFIFNIIYWYIVDKRKKLSSSIAKFNTVLDRFEKTSTEYWTFSYHKRHSKKNLIQEMTMKAEHKILRQCKDGITKQIHQAKLRKTTESELKNALSKLFDVATGGDFESSQRGEDLKRVGEIIKICTQIRMSVAGFNI